MRRPPTIPRLPAALLIMAMTAAACGDGSGVGLPAEDLSFEDASARIDGDTPGTLILRNGSDRRVGPIEIRVGPVEDANGVEQTGAALVADPPMVPTLAPRSSATVTLTLHGADALRPGTFRTDVTAIHDGATRARRTVEVHASAPSDDPIAEITLQVAGQALQGDVLDLHLTALDPSGNPVDDPAVEWTVLPADGGWVGPGRRFVGYSPGPVRIVARAGSAADTALVELAPRTRTLSWTTAGEGVDAGRFTSDLWVHGDYAWTGTWGVRPGPGGGLPGNLLRTWRLEAGGPVATDSLTLDARTTNDVKVSADGSVGVVTHEGSNDGRNGVTLLDLSDPAHPRAFGRYTRGLEPGVHNAWIDGTWLYLVVDGVGSGLRVLDIADPSDPRVVAEYWAGESFLHDVYVRDGLAYLAHWDAGLVILDVGNGIAGGHPWAPIEIGRLRHLGGQTHNVWAWPARGIAFVGEEDFSSPGRLHVVDISEPRAPREIASFAVPGVTPHNVWLDEEREILYAGWYAGGLRAIDVSGDLMGELERQGRELGRWTRPNQAAGCWTGLGSCVWAPQLHEGRVYLAEINVGLVVLTPEGG